MPDEPSTTVDLMSADDLRAQLRRLRMEGPQSWEVPPAGRLADWLTEVSATLAGLGAGADVLQELRSAAVDPDSPDALLGAGWRLIDLGLDAWAVGPLARAERLRPGEPTTVKELGLALEAALAPGDVVRLYDRHPELLDADPSARFQYAFCAALAGDVSPARRLAGTLPAEQPEVARLRTTLEGCVLRAEAVGAHRPLDRMDLRGWHAVLTGGVLLSRSPAEIAGMSGRFGSHWASREDFAAVLDRLQVALDAAARRPGQVLVTGERDDQVLGHAVAQRLGVPAVSPREVPPDGLTLVALFSWGTPRARMAPAVVAAFTGTTHHGNVLGFGYWMDFTAKAWPAPDLVGELAQYVQPPWGERMRMEPWPGDLSDPDPARRPQVFTIPADDRDPAVIGAEAARWTASERGAEAAADLADVVGVVRALGSAPAWSGCHGGVRSAYRPMGPVPSSMFLF